MFEKNFLIDISLDSEDAKIKNNKKSKKFDDCKSFNDNNNINNAKKARGGYRPVLVDESRLIQESIELKQPFELINNTCISNRNFMHDQDIVSYYLVSYLNQRYPNQFIENFNPIISDNLSKPTSILIEDLKIKFKNKNIEKKLDKLKIKTLFDLVNSFNLHSVPYSARYTLVNWYLNNKFDLVLFINSIPTSKDVLLMQAESKRCVSLIADKIDCLVLNERDPLSFLLHDLVHAYKMFNNDYLLKGQIGFYRTIRKIYNSENKSIELYLDSLSKNDEKFGEEFDYLISDMNSHPKHLFFYFKSILINAFKRKFNLNENEILRGDSLNEFNNLFESILNIFDMNENQKDLARKALFEINSITSSNSDSNMINQPFNLIDFTLLDNYFLSLG